MVRPLLSLQEGSIRFGDKPLLQDVTLHLSPGQKACLVGRNGSGKSTLMKVIAEYVPVDSGRVWMQPGVRVAYLSQEPDLTGCDTILDFVCQGAVRGHPLERYVAEAEITALGLEPHRPLGELSGGELRRAALARLFGSEADIVLLDEPTNHLDIDAIEYVERWLKGFRGAALLINHDRVFLKEVTNAIYWLDRAHLRFNNRGFSDLERWQEEVWTQEAEQQHKLKKLIAAETRWSIEGISARRKRNQGRLKRLHDMRDEREGYQNKQGTVRVNLEDSRTSGKLVSRLENVSMCFDDKVIMQPFSTTLLRGDRLGIIGPNGVGKSTLLKIITGEMAPDSGEVRLGTKLDTVYVDQGRSSLDPEKTLWQTLCPTGGDHVRVGSRDRHVVDYLKDFLFDDNQAHSPVKSLSGGEWRRLVLAQAFARPSNLLILDEPTNDLDIETLDLLQEIVADYHGTLILVTHDRDFIDRLVTSVILMPGDGQLYEYTGGYTDAMRKHNQSNGHKQAKNLGPAKAKARAKHFKHPLKNGGDHPPANKKFTFKDKQELDALPALIAKLEKDIVTLQTTLADPLLFKNDLPKAQKFLAALSKLQKQKLTAEDRWLDMEERKSADDE